MKQQIKKIRKRDGRVVEFEPSKVTKAIFKAMEAVGEPNFDLAKGLAKKTIENLQAVLKERDIPKVEQVQDIVEQTLVAEGQARVAKAYILYRQKRSEIRRQKQQILNKEEIDEVDKRFDLNALKVLCSRYLRKDETSRVVESPRQLFQRVATHTALPSVLFDKKLFQKKKGASHQVEDFDPKKIAGKLKIGKYVLNEFHLEGLKMVYDRFNRRGQMKLKFSEVLNLLKKGELSSHEKEIDQYYSLMAERRFFPNTPALINFGSHLGMGSACFCLPVEDSIESIMGALKKAAIIFKSGGGVGYNFSHLRPKGDFVKTTSGRSSGPISFMSLFDKMSDVVKQGGARRGASMGILNSNHPDIEEFIIAKRGNQQLRNFNISVFIKEDFWSYYEEKKPYPLRNPRSGEIVRYIDPRAFFDLIVYQAWESAEPGVLFDDHINKHNPFLKTLGPIECTNPCSELPLYSHDSCNLGSVNLWAFCDAKPTNSRQKDVQFDWDGFAEAIKSATRFLDNVIEVNKFPLPEIEEMTLNMRRIGLGIMGLADVLYELEIPYNSSDGLRFMERVMEFLNYYSKMSSVELAKERGKFPYYDESSYLEGKLPFRGGSRESGELPFSENDEARLDWQALKQQIKQHGLRHAQTTTIAPTGSISMIAGASSGAEPNFSLVYEKKVSIGSFYYVNPVFEKATEREGLFDEDLIKEVSERNGTVQSLAYISPKLKKVFVTAMDIKAEDHIKALASLQKWTDSSISKTINFPSTATVEDMKEAYLLAHQLGCKGLTVFRDKSIQGVLQAGAREKKEKLPKSEGELVSLKDVKAKGPTIYHDVGMDKAPSLQNGNSDNDLCPKCSTTLIRTEGCKKCPKCGWGVCSG